MGISFSVLVLFFNLLFCSDVRASSLHGREINPEVIHAVGISGLFPPPPSGPLLFPPFSLLAFPLGLSARAMPAFSRSLQWRPRRCSTTSTVVVKAVVEFVAGNDEKGRGEYFPSWVVVGRQPFKHFYVFFFFTTFIHVKSFRF